MTKPTPNIAVVAALVLVVSSLIYQFVLSAAGHAQESLEIASAILPLICVGILAWERILKS